MVIYKCALFATVELGLTWVRTLVVVN